MAFYRLDLKNVTEFGTKNLIFESSMIQKPSFGAFKWCLSENLKQNFSHVMSEAELTRQVLRDLASSKSSNSFSYNLASEQGWIRSHYFFQLITKNLMRDNYEVRSKLSIYIQTGSKSAKYLRIMRKELFVKKNDKIPFMIGNKVFFKRHQVHN